MSKRIALGLLALASPLILVTSLWGTDDGDILFSVLAVAFPIALMALGAGRGGTLGVLRWPLLALGLYYEVCVAGMLLLRGKVLGGPWFLGLPLATSIQVYGVFLLPGFCIALLYAGTFERFGLRQEDLDALRRRFAARPAEDTGDGS